MNTVIQLYNDHQIAFWTFVWFALSMVFNMLTRFKSAEQWVELGEKYPRIQNLIRISRALGIDPVKAIRAIGDFLAGKTSNTSTNGK